MAPRSDFPPVRACLFDMDGLLLDTEDKYTEAVNEVLSKYQRPPLQWWLKAKMQGRPALAANAIFQEWAQLPISPEQYVEELTAVKRRLFPSAKPLPGVPELLRDLGRAQYREPKPPGNTNGPAKKPHNHVHIALATSSDRFNFQLKTSHLGELFSVFPSHRRVLGDDERIAPGRGKPLPDIYLVALATINESLPAGEPPVTPEECLVFEDAVPGVEAGRRAGMRVVWCPHPGLKKEYDGREKDVLAGRTYEAGEVDLHQLGDRDDGWAEYMPNLVDFPFAKYGICIPPAETE